MPLDLGTPLTPDRPRVTAEQLAALADWQFHYVAPDPYTDLYPRVARRAARFAPSESSMPDRVGPLV